MVDYSVPTLDQNAKFTTDAFKYEKHVNNDEQWPQYKDLDGLGARFKTALLKLEGLLYVIYGALPDWGYGDDPRRPAAEYPDNQRLWYEREHPRALWPEQKGAYWVFPASGSTRCCGAQYGFYDRAQYLALGDLIGECIDEHRIAGPELPIKSRSGDPLMQFENATHNKDIFPVGSVDRQFSGRNEGGWPRAWDPSRHDEVLVAWLVPQGVEVVSAPKLHYEIDNGPSGTISMQANGNVYTGTIPEGDVHDETCYWYLEVDVKIEGETVTVYDPQKADGSQPRKRKPPADEHDRDPEGRYTYQIFRHIAGPYERGLPELLADHLGSPYNDWNDDFYDRVHDQGEPPGPDNNWGEPGRLKKTTESWVFDDWQTIDYRLINMVRHALDQIAIDCDYAPFHRGEWEGSSQILCCFRFPMVWYWSGSNNHWQYKKGGKSPEGHPLTASEDDPDGGSVAARRSWRGLERLFVNDPFDMPSQSTGGRDDPGYVYGGDASWLGPPPEFESDFNAGNRADWEWTRFFNSSGVEMGVQPCDVIDPVHIEELITAINYVLDKGCWQEVRAGVSPRTPDPKDLTLGECGFLWTEYTGEIGQGCFGNEDKREARCDYMCCPQCEIRGSGNSARPVCTEEWPKPEDWTKCEGGVCKMGQRKEIDCLGLDDRDNGFKNLCRIEKTYVDCDNQTGSTGPYTSWSFQINRWRTFYRNQSCDFAQDCEDDIIAVEIDQRGATYTEGWSAWVCGPRPCVSCIGEFPDEGWNRIDLTHGNQWKKHIRVTLGVTRRPKDVFFASSYGNGYDRDSKPVSCGVGPPNQPDLEPDWLKVGATQYEGITTWITNTPKCPVAFDGLEPCDPPELPGYGRFNPPNPARPSDPLIPLCTDDGVRWYCPNHSDEPMREIYIDNCGNVCYEHEPWARCETNLWDLPFCRPGVNLSLWGKIDLNKDGSGVPILKPFDMGQLWTNPKDPDDKLIPWSEYPCRTNFDYSDICIHHEDDGGRCDGDYTDRGGNCAGPRC